MHPRSSLVASSVLVGHARYLVLKLGVKYRLVSFSTFSSRHSFALLNYPKKNFVVRIASSRNFMLQVMLVIVFIIAVSNISTVTNSFAQGARGLFFS